jgi:hypothetical protein
MRPWRVLLLMSLGVGCTEKATGLPLDATTSDSSNPVGDGSTDSAASVRDGSPTLGDGPAPASCSPLIPSSVMACATPSPTFRRPGFDPTSPPSGAGTARVVTVGANEMVLSGTGGARFSFMWFGPPLPFVAGETIDYSPGASSGTWDVISSSSGTALAFVALRALARPLPPLPGVPSTFALEDGCRFQATTGCGTCEARSKAVRATVRGLESVVEINTTVVVQDWKITNVYSAAVPQSGNPGGCMSESGVIASLAALGPGR